MVGLVMMPRRGTITEPDSDECEWPYEPCSHSHPDDVPQEPISDRLAALWDVRDTPRW